jgi:cell division protein FtsQ
MDGRGRFAEPVNEGAMMRPYAGARSSGRRSRRRGSAVYSRIERYLRRWLGPVRSWALPRGSGIAALLVFALATGAYGAVCGGHVAAVVAELRDVRDSIANAFGFRITTIALAGQQQITREELLTIAGVTGRTSLLFLDASDARARLKANPWIAEATVLKLYPGRLHVSITERAAFALWQKDGRVSVISNDGTVLETFVAKRHADLPLVVGAGADSKAREFLSLIDRYPEVRNQVLASILVADRRWNLKLKSGIDVRLPETDVERAFETLIKLDREKSLLSRDITIVDLRLPDRVTVRLSDDAAAARAEVFKEKKPKKKGGDA